MRHLVHPSPIGPLLLEWEDAGLRRLWMGPREPEGEAAELPGAREQLDAYFARELQRFELPLAPQGTAFQLRVWEALRTIPYGSTWSYGELARHLGDEKLTRAVGAANGANPLAIVIPCHRVIGAGGQLVGFGGGLPRKEFLLRLEGRQEGLFGGGAPAP
jgi:methylated-DNA-[protein]-cysteine S-methyltransferase